jgi:hypothetical protein
MKKLHKIKKNMNNIFKGLLAGYGAKKKVVAVSVLF